MNLISKINTPLELILRIKKQNRKEKCSKCGYKFHQKNPITLCFETCANKYKSLPLKRKMKLAKESNSKCPICNEKLPLGKQTNWEAICPQCNYVSI